LVIGIGDPDKADIVPFDFAESWLFSDERPTFERICPSNEVTKVTFTKSGATKVTFYEIACGCRSAPATVPIFDVL
jgi:hypothetical protein